MTHCLKLLSLYCLRTQIFITSRHPFGLQQDYILGISACAIHPFIHTESDKVTIWIDDTLFKMFIIPFQNPNIHHPKTITLGLQQEKILGISACAVRASVYTESDKVATWIDDTLGVVAQKLEHAAQTFTEFQSDKISSLHTCSLFTCARLESGALYWWYVLDLCCS